MREVDEQRINQRRARGDPSAHALNAFGRVLTERPDITPTLEAVNTLLPLLQQRDLSITSVSAILER